MAELTPEQLVARADRPLHELIADARRFGFRAYYHEMCRLADAAEEMGRLRKVLGEMMVVYAGIGIGAGWEIAPANRELLQRAAEEARRALEEEPRG